MFISFDCSLTQKCTPHFVRNHIKFWVHACISWIRFDMDKKLTFWQWQWPWRWAKFALLFYDVRSLCWLLSGWASTAGFRETLVKFWENKFLDFYSACSRKNFSIWKESWWPEILFMENSLFSRFTSIATPLKNQ